MLTALASLALSVQAGDMFNLSFRAVYYQTNGGGRIVPTAITDQTLLSEAARSGGGNAAGMALVYHIDGSSFGDTIDVVKKSDGSVLHTYFGLYFGDSSELGRTTLSNATGTEIKALDYVYTLETTAFTSPNSHSMGAVTVSKRFSTDKKGNPTTSIQGQNMQWIVVPREGRSTRIFSASFQTKKAFVAGQ
jgi:hypothetical protein